MAIPKRLTYPFEQVFGSGLALTGEGVPVKDYDRSTKETFVQATDPETGLPWFKFECMDLDPDAHKSARLVTVKIASDVMPVPITVGELGPFKLVRLEGLQISPYVKRDGDFSSLAWSYIASGFAGAGSAKSERSA